MAETTTRLPDQVFVVSMAGNVLLMVDGPQSPTNNDLVDEIRASFVATGVHDDEISVVWQASPLPR